MHERFAMLGFTGSKRQSTVPHDEGRDSMPTRRGEQGVPKNLRVVVSMYINKTRRHRAAIGVDDFTRIAADLPDRDDATILDRNVSGVTIRTGPVDNASVFDQQVVPHSNPPSVK